MHHPLHISRLVIDVLEDNPVKFVVEQRKAPKDGRSQGLNIAEQLIIRVRLGKTKLVTLSQVKRSMKSYHEAKHKAGRNH